MPGTPSTRLVQDQGITRRLDPHQGRLCPAQGDERTPNTIGGRVAGRARQLGRNLGARHQPEVEQPAALGTLTDLGNIDDVNRLADPRVEERGAARIRLFSRREIPHGDVVGRNRVQRPVTSMGPQTNGAVRPPNHLQAGAQRQSFFDQPVVNLARFILEVQDLNDATRLGGRQSEAEFRR